MKIRFLIICCTIVWYSCSNLDKSPNAEINKIENVDFCYLQYEIKNMNDTRLIQIKDRNISFISIYQDSILYDFDLIDEDSLYFKIIEFIKSDPNNNNLPEFEYCNLPGVGNEMISKHMIVIQADSTISYNRYFHIRHEILRAYNTLRDEYSREKFGVAYKDLFLDNKPEHFNYKLILDFKYPIRISESLRK